MRVISGRADARWLPSRFRFALFRLFAFVRMRAAKPEPRDVALVIDRNQSVIESYTISAWTALTVVCYLAETLLDSWPLPLAFIAAIPLVNVVFEIPIILLGTIVRRDRNNLDTQSAFLMVLLSAASLYIALAESFARSWIRFAAWQFLALVALNAIAAALMFLLRGAIARMETEVGGITSEL